VIYTSYYAKSGSLPNAVSISGKTPDFFEGDQIKCLAPKWDFFKVYKETGDKNFYIEQYVSRVLSVLDVQEIATRLEGKIMLCYEKTGDFCHRHIVAKWLIKHGYEVKEL
jgi:uncharacterized protein (DUF488 family)